MTEKSTIKKIKFRFYLEVYELDGIPKIHFSSDEDNSTLQDIAMAVYYLEKAKLSLIDRNWHGEGYEIIDDGDDNDEEEKN